MMKNIRLAKGAAGLCLAIVALPAQAAVFEWKITGSFAGSGRLTTTDTTFAYDAEEPIAGQSVAGYLVTSMTGIFRNVAVSLMPPAPDKAPFFATNLLYPTGIAPFVDDGGLVFKAGQTTYGLFSSLTCGGDTGACRNVARIGYPGINGGSRQVTFSISAVKAAVPEPSSWAMMIAGFAVVGMALRRGRVQVRYAGR